MAMATLVLALAAALAPAAPGTLTYGVKAGLDGRQQVPPVAAKATGTLSGTLAVNGTRALLKWELTYRRLSGRALRAEIHRGRIGRRGPRLAVLCHPCRAGAHASTPLAAAAVMAVRNGSAYVVVTTRKHPAGEIRGQMRVLGGA
jgi:hypothetical protein